MPIFSIFSAVVRNTIHHPRTSITVLRLLSTNSDKKLLIESLVTPNKTEANAEIDSISRRMAIKSLDEPRQVVLLFKRFGFTDYYLTKMLMRRVTTLFISPLQIESKLKLMLPGYSNVEPGRSNQLVSAISCCSQVFRSNLDVEEFMVPVDKFLRERFYSDYCTEAITRLWAFLQLCAIDKDIIFRNLPKNIDFLYGKRTPNAIILYLISISAKVACLEPEKFVATVHKAEELRIRNIVPSYADALIAIADQGSTKWKQRLDAYKNWGVHDEEIARTFEYEPRMMNISISKIMKAMSFFVNEMGYHSSFVLSFAPCWAYPSLEDTVIPRCSVIRVLTLELLLEREPSLYSYLRISENRFLERYVYKYMDQVPDLLSLAKGEKKISELGYKFPGEDKVAGSSTTQSQHIGSVDDVAQPHSWPSPGGGHKIPIAKQIFCNKSVNMEGITAVGFDMDYTLAQYKPETYEFLAYEGTKRKLVNDLGYPEELLRWSFDWKYMIRGLVLDKKTGNVLKMDRHKYVKVAYHGFRELSMEEIVGTYGSTLIRDALDEPDWALIDTLSSLSEAYLFAQLVDFKDNNPGKISAGTDYARMYRDVRTAVDLCHRDGALKKMVAKDPERYINEDTSIVPILKMFRDSGRSTFLLTNSPWDYTNIVMNFLCGGRTLDHGSCNFDWLQYFDVVISGCAKPGFFYEDNRANLFEVEPKTGMLIDNDKGSPMAQAGDTPRIVLEGPNNNCRVFQGGNVAHLHKLLSIESSSQVLYVGDQIYGDILCSKGVPGMTII